MFPESPGFLSCSSMLFYRSPCNNMHQLRSVSGKFCNFPSGWHRITARSVMWHTVVYYLKISSYLKSKYSDIISLLASYDIYNPIIWYIYIYITFIDFDMWLWNVMSSIFIQSYFVWSVLFIIKFSQQSPNPKRFPAHHSLTQEFSRKTWHQIWQYRSVSPLLIFPSWVQPCLSVLIYEQKCHCFIRQASSWCP